MARHLHALAAAFAAAFVSFSALAQTPPAAIPSAPKPPPSVLDSLWPYVQIMGAILILIGALVAALWAFRQYGAKLGFDPGKGMLEPKARMALGGNRSVVVVRFLNKLLVLGVTDHAVTKLAETPYDHADHRSTDFSAALRFADKSASGNPGNPD